MLKNRGTMIGEPFIKHLEGEIWELRPLRDRILFAAWSIMTVVKALIKTYNAATDENDKKGWGPFIIALILGFILIFFSLWLVKLAIGLF